MNTIDIRSQQLADSFGRKVAARLSEGTAELPYEVNERLRAARVQALARRKRAVQAPVAPVILHSGGAAILGNGSDTSLWTRIASALPLVALAAGLILIHSIQDERRAYELAEVDAALLTDDLPPDAYADPGFMQFVKTRSE
jgi:hypothetical protein